MPNFFKPDYSLIDSMKDKDISRIIVMNKTNYDQIGHAEKPIENGDISLYMIEDTELPDLDVKGITYINNIVIPPLAEDARIFKDYLREAYIDINYINNKTDPRPLITDNSNNDPIKIITKHRLFLIEIYEKYNNMIELVHNDIIKLKPDDLIEFDTPSKKYRIIESDTVYNTIFSKFKNYLNQFVLTYQVIKTNDFEKGKKICFDYRFDKKNFNNDNVDQYKNIIELYNKFNNHDGKQYISDFTIESFGSMLLNEYQTIGTLYNFIKNYENFLEIFFEKMFKYIHTYIQDNKAKIDSFVKTETASVIIDQINVKDIDSKLYDIKTNSQLKYISPEIDTIILMLSELYKQLAKQKKYITLPMTKPSVLDDIKNSSENIFSRLIGYFEGRYYTIGPPPVSEVSKTVNEDILKQYIKCKLIQSVVGFENYIENTPETEQQKKKINIYVYKQIIRKNIKDFYSCDKDLLFSQIKGISAENRQKLKDIDNNILKKNTFKKDKTEMDHLTLFRDLITDKKNPDDLREKIIRMYELDYLYGKYRDKISNTFNIGQSIFNQPKIIYKDLPPIKVFDDKGNVPKDFKLSEDFKLDNIQNINDDGQILRKRINNFIKLYLEYINAIVELLFTGDEDVLKIFFGDKTTEKYDQKKIETKYSKLLNSKKFNTNHTNDTFNKEYLFKLKLFNYLDTKDNNTLVKNVLCKDINPAFCFENHNYATLFKNIIENLKVEDKIDDKYYEKREITFSDRDGKPQKKMELTFKFSEFDTDFKTNDGYDNFIRELINKEIYYPELIGVINNYGKNKSKK